MGLSNSGRNVGLSAVGAVGLYVSLHTADPGTSGTSEVTGGSPAYARKAVTWASPSGGSMALASGVTFDVPAGATVTHYGVWSAVSGGTFYGSGALSASEAFAGQGTYNLSAATISVT
ncbi:hypothetical protein GCM10010402_66070 [Actinomadura luteofluorescens]|uniref:phage tail fiber protein n=1 Tax=Actinomadura luteofluorescens TaxID=46163 RepID=UPI002164CD44|nr:hypothetical protein [Actinomadura glauciflava]MCR3744220.1 hypothetical protein [Actinomadura glauciflava]